MYRKKRCKPHTSGKYFLNGATISSLRLKRKREYWFHISEIKFKEDQAAKVRGLDYLTGF